MRLSLGATSVEEAMIRSRSIALRRAFETASLRAALAWGRFTRGMTLGVRALVIGPEGHIFLVKHSYVTGWHLPGGGVEPGETLIDALIRELREEANLELTARPILHGVFLNARLSIRDHVAVFVIKEFRQIAVPVPNFEIIAHGFFSMAELPNDTTQETRARIVEALGSEPAAEHW